MKKKIKEFINSLEMICTKNHINSYEKIKELKEIVEDIPSKEKIKLFESNNSSILDFKKKNNKYRNILIASFLAFFTIYMIFSKNHNIKNTIIFCSLFIILYVFFSLRLIYCSSRIKFSDEQKKNCNYQEIS